MAVILALVLGGAVAAPAVLPAAADTDTGGMSWGLKESWRAYVKQVGILPGDGATKDDAGIVTFPVESAAFDAVTGTTDVRLSGNVHYQGWCGQFYAECALDILIENPRIVIGPDEQTLYAHVHSRLRANAVDGVPPAIVDYGEIPYARLDSGPATVTTELGRTEWSGVLAAMTAEAVPTIGYDAGTALDTISFSYDGPGGRPVVNDVWTPAGTALIEETHSWTQGESEVLRGQPTDLFVDDERGVIHLLSQGNSIGAVKVQAFDADDLTPLGAELRVGSPSKVRAFDPETGTVFFSEINTSIQPLRDRIYALTYDGTTGAYTRTEVTSRATNAIKGAVWNAAEDRLVTIETVGGATPAANLVTWSRGDGGAWTSETIPLPAPPGGANPVTYYSPTANQGLAAAADGSILIGRFDAVVRLTPGEGQATATTFSIDSDAENVGHTSIVTGADGSIWVFGGDERITRFALAEDGAVVQSGEPVEVGAFDWASVDTDGVVWLKGQTAASVVAVDDGVVTFRKVFTGLDRAAPIAAAEDGVLYTAFRTATTYSGLARLAQTGVSPTVTGSPNDVAIAVAEGAEATFAAAAAGTPAPTAQWQVRNPGATRFVDITGATGPTYTVPVEAGRDGAQYRAVFTNDAGSIATDAATLTVLSAPSIVQQPLDTTVNPNANAHFQVLASGTPEPAVVWQRDAGDGWADVAGDGYEVDGGNLTVLGATESADYRAVVRNDLGEVFSDVVTLTVKPVTVGEDGSVTGLPNQAGAVTSVTPGIEVPIADGGTPLEVTGSGFTRNTNQAGVYVLFGYMVTPPSAGASAGSGYDFLPGSGDSGQLGQLFIAWPGNDQTGGEANGTLSSTTDGGFTATGLVAKTRFTAQSGASVDCLDGSVSCGVLTIGAHGGRDAALETFTPIYFTGQSVPEGSIDPPTIPIPPVVPAVDPPVQTSEEGSLVWGVKASFRNYIVSATAKGAVALSGGASRSGGAFWFGQAGQAWDAATGLGSADYRGAVRFTGHAGILDLTIADPTVRIDSPTSGTLLVTANGSRLAIGTVDLGDASRRDVTGGVAYTRAPVTLTAAGAGVFSYGSSQFYGAGTDMDPVSFTIGANATSGGGGGGTVAAFDKSAWTPPATPPATEGIQGDPKALAGLRAGSQVTVWADGFQPDETDIKVVLYSDPVVLEESLAADASGRATWTGLIPVTLAPGTHTLTFQGSVDRGLVITVGAPRLEGCTVEGATLGWGFKESFRSYIEGSIAHGEWIVGDGATYQNMAFGWSGGKGVYDADTRKGLVTFPGTVRFTGHDGLLNTTIANPQLQFVDESTAYLLLDVTGVTMEDAMAGTTDAPVATTAVPFVKLDLTGGSVVVGGDGRITATAVPTEITSAGYAAFPNYETGTAFDPVSFTVAPADCAVAATQRSVVEAAQPESAASGSDLGWLWWVGIGTLVVAALIVALILMLRRRRPADPLG